MTKLKTPRQAALGWMILIGGISTSYFFFHVGETKQKQANDRSAIGIDRNSASRDPAYALKTSDLAGEQVGFMPTVVDTTAYILPSTHPINSLPGVPPIVVNRDDLISGSRSSLAIKMIPIEELKALKPPIDTIPRSFPSELRLGGSGNPSDPNKALSISTSASVLQPSTTLPLVPINSNSSQPLSQLSSPSNGARGSPIGTVVNHAETAIHWPEKEFDSPRVNRLPVSGEKQTIESTQANESRSPSFRPIANRMNGLDPVSLGPPTSTPPNSLQPTATPIDNRLFQPKNSSVRPVAPNTQPSLRERQFISPPKGR